MKTYLITNSGIVEDTTAARTDEFNFLAEWTGDEWTRDNREEFATRYVSEDCSDPEDLDDPSILEKPWTVSYDDREKSSTESIEVARFATEAEAEAFAKSENSRLLRDYLQGDNHLTVSLPDGWDMDYGQPRNGKYPLSRNTLCTLSAQGVTVQRTAHWSARGVTDSWINFMEVHETLIDLMDHLLTEAMEITAEKETEPR